LVTGRGIRAQFALAVRLIALCPSGGGRSQNPDKRFYTFFRFGKINVRKIVAKTVNRKPIFTARASFVKTTTTAYSVLKITMAAIGKINNSCIKVNMPLKKFIFKNSSFKIVNMKNSASATLIQTMVFVVRVMFKICYI
jgi:hypothetical protein